MSVSVSVAVRDSTIHGLGVFAEEDLPAGIVVGSYEGEVTSDNGTYVLWVEQEDGSEVGIDGRNELRFLNHSPRPNCEFEGSELRTLAPVAAGSELTFHYGDDWDEPS